MKKILLRLCYPNIVWFEVTAALETMNRTPVLCEDDIRKAIGKPPSGRPQRRFWGGGIHG